MQDVILGVLKDSKCPKCGSTKVICNMQYPLQVEMDMKGKIIRINPRTGKRMKLSNEWKAFKFDMSLCDFQCANYKCEKCGWESEVYTQ